MIVVIYIWKKYLIKPEKPIILAQSRHKWEIKVVLVMFLLFVVTRRKTV